MVMQTAKLSDVADINPRLSVRLSDDESISFVPMPAVSAEMANVQGAMDRRYAEVSKGYTPFKSGDLLVAKITPCFENGKIAQATIGREWGFGSTEFHVIRAAEDKVNHRYLLHFLRQPFVRREGERKMTGSAGQRRVPEHFLAQLEIPLPTLAEQIRIANILDEVQVLRAKRREAIELCDKLQQSLFLEAFGDPNINPLGWDTADLGTICDGPGLIVDGPFGSSLKPDSYIEAGVRVIRNFNINDNSFNGSEFKYISNEKFSEIKRSEVLAGDILISTKGTIGDICLMPNLPGTNVLSASGTVRVRIENERRLIARFLVHQLTLPQSKYRIRSLESGSIQKYLTLNSVRKISFIVPPIQAQADFLSRIDKLEEIRTRQINSLLALDVLFASLQHRAFRGEL